PLYFGNSTLAVALGCHSRKTALAADRSVGTREDIAGFSSPRASSDEFWQIVAHASIIAAPARRRGIVNLAKELTVKDYVMLPAPAAGNSRAHHRHNSEDMGGRKLPPQSRRPPAPYTASLIRI